MFNKVILIGRMGSDPDIRIFRESGSKVATFNIATKESYPDDKEPNGWKEKTTWHRIKIYGKAVDNFKGQKGDLVLIEGKIDNRQYQNQAGETVRITEIVAQKTRIISRAQSSYDNQPQSNYNPPAPSTGYEGGF